MSDFSASGLDAPTDRGDGIAACAEEPAANRWIGEHEILGEIARGGMGVVYRARQHSLDRIVALKMILDDRFVGQKFARQLIAEAESAARLDHPGIVPIYEAGSHLGRPFFTMALVDGESLAARLRSGPLPPREASRIVRDVSAAIEHAHQRGVIHLDLKPANIMLEPSGRARVTDFGIARRYFEAADSSIEFDQEKLTKIARTFESSIVGTPPFMSPEQVDQKKTAPGPLSDVYSLGAVLYACVTGRPPYYAATSPEIIAQILAHDAISPRRLNPAVMPELEAIILQCLTKEPCRRYASAQDLAEDLSRFLEGQPVLARSPHGVSWLWRQLRRHVVLASVSGVFAFGLIFLAIFITVAFIGSAYQVQKLEADILDLRSTLEIERRSMRGALKSSSTETADFIEAQRLIDHALLQEQKNPQLAVLLAIKAFQSGEATVKAASRQLLVKLLQGTAPDARAVSPLGTGENDEDLRRRGLQFVGRDFTNLERERFGLVSEGNLKSIKVNQD